MLRNLVAALLQLVVDRLRDQNLPCLTDTEDTSSINVFEDIFPATKYSVSVSELLIIH